MINLPCSMLSNMVAVGDMHRKNLAFCSKFSS